MPPAPRILVSAITLIVLLLVAACIGTKAPGQSTITADSTATLATDSAPTPPSVCFWLLQANKLRAERIVSALPIGDWMVKYSSEGAAELDEDAFDEFADLVRTHHPNVLAFLTAWEQLGPHEDSREFWRAELEANKAQSQAMDQLVRGYDLGNWDAVDEGLAAMMEAAPQGRASEVLMMEVMKKCGY